LTARWVAPEREYVLDPRLLDPVENRPELVPGRTDAAEVRHRLDPQVVLDPLRELNRPIAGRAACAVGDRSEIRLERAQVLERAAQVLPPLVGLRGEELKREDRLVGRGEDLVDAH